MQLVKDGRKWSAKGKGEGWVFERTFATKWRAQVAMEVFQAGGRVSDYWKAARDYAEKHPSPGPWRALQEIQKALDVIDALKPTCDEIEAYGDIAGHGAVTYTQQKGYFPPQIHNTWGYKRGGRVHIDIGCRGCHLMLDRSAANDFIRFIQARRASPSTSPGPLT